MPGGWEDVGRRIAAERARRWRHRSAFAAVTGLSVRTLADLETGARTRYQPATLSAVEVALGWTAGSIEEMAYGGRPRRAFDRELTRVVDAWPHLSPDARLMLADLADRNRA